MRKLIIDADFLCYAAAFAAERTSYLLLHADKSASGPFDRRADAPELQEGDEIYERTDALDFAIARKALDSKVRSILTDCGSKFGKLEPAFYLTGTANFRERIHVVPGYKSNRAATRKPVHLSRLRAHLVAEYGAVVVHWMEADDAVAIAWTAEQDSVVCGVDKDLKQLPAIHAIPGQGFFKVSRMTALRNLYTQIIAGDATDGVKGAFKAGPARAAKVLADCKDEASMWKAALTVYQDSEKKYGEPWPGSDALSAAVTTARLVHLLREMPADAAHPTLWEPPNGRS